MKKNKMKSFWSSICCVALALICAFSTTPVKAATKASAETQVKKEYFLKDGDGTGLTTSSSGSITDGAWTFSEGWPATLTYATGARDMSAMITRGAKLYIEMTREAAEVVSWGKVGIVSNQGNAYYVKGQGLFAWSSTTAMLTIDVGGTLYDNNDAAMDAIAADYLSTFKGIAIGTSCKFTVKNIWFEYTEEVEDSTPIESADVVAKEYFFKDGNGTGLSADSFADGVWAIPAGGWTTHKLMYAEKAQQDLSYLAEKKAKLYLEVEGTSTDGSYAEVGVISQADWWDEPYDFYKASLCANAGYNTVEIALDSFIPTKDQADKTHTTSALLAKFRGISLKTDKGFNIKNIWFEYTETVSVSVQNGASIRCESPTGIRFASEIPYDGYNALVAEVGADNVTVGTLIVPTDWLTSVDFTIDGLNATGKTYLNVVANNGWVNEATAEADGKYVFYSAMVNVQADNYCRAFSARSYITYVKDGKTTTIYSNYVAENHSRSVYEVAMGTFKDTNNSEMMRAAVKGYMDSVANITVDGATCSMTVIDGYTSAYTASMDGNVITITGNLTALKSVLVDGKAYKITVVDDNTATVTVG